MNLDLVQMVDHSIVRKNCNVSETVSDTTRVGSRLILGKCCAVH